MSYTDKKYWEAEVARRLGKKRPRLKQDYATREEAVAAVETELGERTTRREERGDGVRWFDEDGRKIARVTDIRGPFPIDVLPAFDDLGSTPKGQSRRYLIWVESAEMWTPLATARLFGSLTKSQADAIVADIRKGASSYFPGVKKTARIRVLTDDKRLDLYSGEELGAVRVGGETPGSEITPDSVSGLMRALNATFRPATRSWMLRNLVIFAQGPDREMWAHSGTPEEKWFRRDKDGDISLGTRGGGRVENVRASVIDRIGAMYAAFESAGIGHKALPTLEVAYGWGNPYNSEKVNRSLQDEARALIRRVAGEADADDVLSDFGVAPKEPSIWMYNYVTGYWQAEFTGVSAQERLRYFPDDPGRRLCCATVSAQKPRKPPPDNQIPRVERSLGATTDAGPTYLPMSERTKNAVLRAAADPGAVLPYAATAPKSDVKPWPGEVRTEADYEARSAYYREQQQSPPRVPEFPVGALRIGRDGVKVEELRSFRPDELVPSEDEKRGPVVDKYVRWVESGSAVPPLTVLEVLPHGMGGGTVADWQNAGRPVVYQVSDGHHRIAALKKAKKGKRARVLAWVGVSAVKILERTDGELVPHPVGVSLALARELAEA